MKKTRQAIKNQIRQLAAEAKELRAEAAQIEDEISQLESMLTDERWNLTEEWPGLLRLRELLETGLKRGISWLEQEALELAIENPFELDDFQRARIKTLSNTLLNFYMELPA